jgi:hypothetical protein
MTQKKNTKAKAKHDANVSKKKQKKKEMQEQLPINKEVEQEELVAPRFVDVYRLVQRGPNTGYRVSVNPISCPSVRCEQFHFDCTHCINDMDRQVQQRLPAAIKQIKEHEAKQGNLGGQRPGGIITPQGQPLPPIRSNQ